MANPGVKRALFATKGLWCRGKPAFLCRRKLAEQNGRKKSKTSKKGQAGSLPPTAPAVGVAPVSAGGATGWSKMPKKKKKGQKVDATMLGFAMGTNYAALEKLES